MLSLYSISLCKVKCLGLAIACFNGVFFYYHLALKANRSGVKAPAAFVGHVKR